MKTCNFGEAELALTPFIFAQTGQSPQDLDASAPCLSYGSTRINIVRMPQDCAHYATRRCGNCERFIKWLPSPKPELFSNEGGQW